MEVLPSIAKNKLPTEPLIIEINLFTIMCDTFAFTDLSQTQDLLQGDTIVILM